MMFRNIIDSQKDNKFVFTVIGALFGLCARFLVVDLMGFDEGGEFFDLSFLTAGAFSGFSLHWLWKMLFIPNEEIQNVPEEEIQIESEVEVYCAQRPLKSRIFY